MSWIIHFEIIETIIQMLHIALISIYWNTHNNLMFHIYTWTCWWIFSHLLNYQHLHMSWIIYFELVVPVTFGQPWLCHSSHPERAVVPTDVVRISESAVCTLMLSVRVFTPLFDMRKPKTPVLTFWTLVPESFGNFRKHAPLYNRRFFR